MFGGQIIERHIEFREQEGVVVFLDALGIKGISSRMDPIKVLERWNRVYYAFETAVSSGKDDLHFSITLPRVNIQFSAFSDTVIITAASKEAFQKRPAEFIQYVADIIISPFVTAIREQFFFRGAISIGKFYLSNRMVIGPAVDEAAEYYKLPNWIGISVSKSAASIMNSYDNYSSKILIRYDIPYKEDKKEANGWALAWYRPDYTHFYECTDKLKHERDLLRKEGNEEYIKYANTLDFCNHMKRTR